MDTGEQLRERKRKRPFKPFRVIMESGDSHDVSHPNLILVLTQECHIGTPSRVDPMYYETTTRVQIPQIKAIEDLPVSSPSGDDDR